MTTPPPAEEKQYWLDNPRNVDRLVYAFYAMCAVVVAIDVFFPKHGPFALEHFFGFYGFYGFIACVVLVVLAKQLRRILMRSEDYYDR